MGDGNGSKRYTTNQSTVIVTRNRKMPVAAFLSWMRPKFMIDMQIWWSYLQTWTRYKDFCKICDGRTHRRTDGQSFIISCPRPIGGTCPFPGIKPTMRHLSRLISLLKIRKSILLITKWGELQTISYPVIKDKWPEECILTQFSRCNSSGILRHLPKIAKIVIMSLLYSQSPQSQNNIEGHKYDWLTKTRSSKAFE